jgi:outer membrane lipoprotein SlyB
MGSSDDPCNVVVGAAAGAALGALLGGKDRGKGALIGATVGALACVAVNAVSRQTKSAEQVEADYRNQHAGKLPAGEPVVQAYNVNVNPDDQVRPGEKVQVVSNMTVVRGADKPIQDVKEVLTLSGPDGTKTAEKKPTERPGSGAYENTFTLTFPKDVAPGTYPIKTQLLVNGKQASERKQNLIIVSADGVRHYALVDR